MTTTKKPRRMARPLPESDTNPIGNDVDADADADASAADRGQPAAPRASKKSMLIAMLGEEGGASLAAIVAATDWLPHTARAALTGLRKQGHKIERFSLDGETRYRIAPAMDAQ